MPELHPVGRVFEADTLGFAVQVRLHLVCQRLESIQLDKSLR
jgi:hypothetical protein